MSPVSLPKGAAKIGKYSMSKEELDASLRGFAQDYSTDKMRFKVKVTNSKIVFESSYKVLGYAVPLYVYFTPLVSESGAVVLLTVTTLIRARFKAKSPKNNHFHTLLT